MLPILEGLKAVEVMDKGTTYSYINTKFLDDLQLQLRQENRYRINPSLASLEQDLEIAQLLLRSLRSQEMKNKEFEDAIAELFDTAFAKLEVLTKPAEGFTTISLGIDM